MGNISGIELFSTKRHGLTISINLYFHFSFIGKAIENRSIYSRDKIFIDNEKQYSHTYNCESLFMTYE